VTATCAAVSAALGEPVAGSASTIGSWVLIEHDGPWGPDAREEVFAATLGEQRWALFNDIWMERQLRPLLVRRPAGHPESRRGRRSTGGTGGTGGIGGVGGTGGTGGTGGAGGTGEARQRPSRVIVGSAHGGGFLELTDVVGLRDLDLAALADGRPGHGEPMTVPAFLVCTNGAVDRCCALDGRRLVDALGAEHPDLVWECTHLGGCRFAANLLSLPSGQMHGRLTPEAGSAVVRAALAGVVAADGWRGLTTAPSWAALATEHLRESLGLPSPADVHVLDVRQHRDTVPGEDGDGPAGCDVLLAHGDRRWRVVLRTELLGPRVSACDEEGELFRTPVVTAADLLP
jgi:hypothetical protein